MKRKFEAQRDKEFAAQDNASRGVRKEVFAIRLAVRYAVSRCPLTGPPALRRSGGGPFSLLRDNPLWDFRMNVHKRTYARPKSRYPRTVIRWNAWRHGALWIDCAIVGADLVQFERWEANPVA